MIDLQDFIRNRQNVNLFDGKSTYREHVWSHSRMKCLRCGLTSMELTQRKAKGIDARACKSTESK